MATPSEFNSDMLKQMVKALADFSPPPRQSLMMSAGFRKALARETPPIIGAGDGNPLLHGYTQSYVGIPVEPFAIPPEEVIDWSGCRSPSRAKRRHAQGIPQRIKIEYRERAYLINRDALARFGLEMDARMIAAIHTIKAER
jgi:hypothetical protein